ncbi:helix-turn-helix domain-containing protein [Sporocytophaga myxococcoides]|uniref:helix-turn-helix domain-containing protein n=1 Tax=Sporocytophaga myxococcoides TaxID=153721 RepID=UPI000684019B|nr:helix-turn-helix transcriptional regulator [Sporocytophaga myxococcoides]
MNSITERILAILENKELTPSSFADTIGIQRSSMSHILSGRNKPSLDVIHKILITFPDILSDWLLTGKGPMKQLNLFGEPQKTDPEEEKKQIRKELEKKEEILAKAEVSAEIVSGLLFSENTSPAQTESFYTPESEPSVDAFFNSIFENANFFKEQHDEILEEKSDADIEDIFTRTEAKEKEYPESLLISDSEISPEAKLTEELSISPESEAISEVEAIENPGEIIEEIENIKDLEGIEVVNELTAIQEIELPIFPPQEPEKEVEALSVEAKNPESEEIQPELENIEQTINQPITEAKEIVMITETMREVENSANSNLTVNAQDAAFQPVAEKKPVQKPKKVQKIVIFYDDGTFSAHSPE